MTHTFKLLLLVILLPFIPVALADSVPIIDSSFEAGTGDFQPVKVQGSWYGSSYYMPAYARSGAKTAMFDYNNSFLYANQSFEVYVQSNISITVWGRGLNNEMAYFNISLIQYSDDSVLSTELKTISGNTYEKKYLNYTNLAPGTYYLSFFFNGTSGSNSVLLDDVEITSVLYQVTSGIQGTVYEIVSGAQVPISGATVYLYNSTYSTFTQSSSSGVYIFYNLTNTTYNIYASKSGYDTTVHLPITAYNGSVYIYNILMIKTEPTDFESDKQKVKFNVRWKWCFINCQIQGTTVTVYVFGDSTAYRSGSTDSIGTISFDDLYKSTLYNITFVNSTAGIYKAMTLYPKDSEYVVLIDNPETTMQEFDTQQKDAIIIDVSKTVLNSTAANITINFTDSLAQTTALKYWINQTNLSDPNNQTVISSWTWVAGTYNHTFTIFNQSGQSYLVHIVVTHTTYGTIDRTYAVIFEKTAGVGITGISNTLWMWFAVGIMFFTGAMFTSSTVEKGLLIVCAEGWIFFFMGMFASLNAIQFGVGLTMASVIAVLAYFKRSQAAEGYT